MTEREQILLNEKKPTIAGEVRVMCMAFILLNQISKQYKQFKNYQNGKNNYL